MQHRTCRVGVHGRNQETFHELDFQVLRKANIEVTKMMSHTQPQVFERIKNDKMDLLLFYTNVFQAKILLMTKKGVFME